ncbi:LPXTG cell wall anchor domain-containing protein [Apilactobacillus zhangqiuensis]|uniref:LPXTG cell wall anchor domain-containing protein n=1 Tax=Apilactobacillus zhangqiuensis TaxID=2841031 RepID=UPI001C7D32EB|nr:LPXTG cell wall anchor domain-containing protein [Apilactobacillus zhangqiuensis]
MKFNKKDSKLFKNTKKFVYVSAITGVLLTGTQAGQFTSTYTAHADETAQSNNYATIFVDQFGNAIPGSVYPIQAGITAQSSADFKQSYKANGVNVSDMPDTFDLTSQHTYVLTQPTHTLTINLVDQNGHTVETKTVSNVTNFGQTKTDDLATWAQDNKYGYDSFPSAVDNSQTTVNISVKAPTTTVVNENTQQNSTTTETNTETTQSSATTTVQSNASDETVKSSAQPSSSAQSFASSDEKKESASSTSTSEATKPVEQSSESTKQSSAASENVKSEADSSSAVTSTESSAQSSTASSAASQAPKNDEKTMVIVDPVNKGEHKKAQQTPAADKKDVRAKLPQTGDNTNQARAIALGVATIAVGIGVAYYGLRRKNK